MVLAGVIVLALAWFTFAAIQQAQTGQPLAKKARPGKSLKGHGKGHVRKPRFNAAKPVAVLDTAGDPSIP
jgi:hypothetical protein